MKTEKWKQSADHFINNEKEFHLGFLVTETSHPYTKNLDKVIKSSTADGIRQLLKVDSDIAEVFPGCIRTIETEKLQKTITSSIKNGRRIIFSGCGSTGRLAVLLESLWRKGCILLADKLESGKDTSSTADLLRKSAAGVRGIITGGDRALIKSVENFEDFQVFGRQQVKELHLSEGDVFIAVSEGGETSSVIGSAHEALEKGCTTFFVFNNPETTLRNKIKRSRILIETPGLTAIDVTTGPMAVSGSTRMQATTMELLYLGSILETALIDFLKGNSKIPVYKDFELAEQGDYPKAFNSLLKSFERIDNIENIASIIELQEREYNNGKTVLYAAVDFLLDIFTDTTEQTPTFSLPPFRSTYAPDSPAPWAAALHPVKGTKESWLEMLGREPAGLSWDQNLYKKLNTPDIAANPPKLDRDEIYSYKIGREGFNLYKKEASTLINIIFPAVSKAEFPDSSSINSIQHVYNFVVTPEGKPRAGEYTSDFEVILSLPSSPLQLFSHIAAKILFNTISTGTMARMGRIKGNWMIEVTPSNKKLIDRSIRIISDLKSVSYREAAYLVFKEIEREPEDLSSLVARLL